MFPDRNLPAPRARGDAAGRDAGADEDAAADAADAEAAAAEQVLLGALNAEQRAVADRLLPFMAPPAPIEPGAPPPLPPPPSPSPLLVHGGPGTGKSHLINTVVALAARRGATTLCLAPMAAAANLIGGSTIHGGLGISSGTGYEPPTALTAANVERLRACVARLLGGCLTRPHA
jgi:hypothetical protein